VAPHFQHLRRSAGRQPIAQEKRGRHHGTRRQTRHRSGETVDDGENNERRKGQQDSHEFPLLAQWAAVHFDSAGKGGNEMNPT